MTTATVNRYELNDYLRAYLDAAGWYADSEADMDALNDLTHNVADMVEAFLNAPHVPDDDAGGITPEGLALGHRYVMGNVNAYCPKCSEGQGVCVLDCDYDLDK